MKVHARAEATMAIYRIAAASLFLIFLPPAAEAAQQYISSPAKNEIMHCGGASEVFFNVNPQGQSVTQAMNFGFGFDLNLVDIKSMKKHINEYFGGPILNDDMITYTVNKYFYLENVRNMPFSKEPIFPDRQVVEISNDRDEIKIGFSVQSQPFVIIIKKDYKTYRLAVFENQLTSGKEANDWNVETAGKNLPKLRAGTNTAEYIGQCIPTE